MGLVVLSGGLDSATCLLIAKKEAQELFALSFDYGQRHRFELDRAPSGQAHRHEDHEHDNHPDTEGAGKSLSREVQKA